MDLETRVEHCCNTGDNMLKMWKVRQYNDRQLKVGCSHFVSIRDEMDRIESISKEHHGCTPLMVKYKS